MKFCHSCEDNVRLESCMQSKESDICSNIWCWSYAEDLSFADYSQENFMLFRNRLNYTRCALLLQILKDAKCQPL